MKITNSITITRVLAKEGTRSEDLSACEGCMFLPSEGTSGNCIRVTEIMVQQGLGDCEEFSPASGRVIDYIYIRVENV